MPSEKFSQEKYHDYLQRDFDPTGMNILKELKEKAKDQQNLFREINAQRLENFKTLFPKEFEILQNIDYFNELTESEQAEITDSFKKLSFEKFLKKRFPSHMKTAS